MIYLTIAVVLILLFLSLVTEKKLYNPLTIFLGMWLFICGLASMRLFDMYDYSYRAPLVILIGVVGVYLGYMAGKRFKIKTTFKMPIIGIRENKEYLVRSKLLIVLLVFAIVVYAAIAVSVLALLAAGFDASTIRELYRDGGETALSGMASTMIYGSRLLKILDNYVAKTIVLASIPIMSIELTEKGKFTLLSILAMVALGLSMFVNFGRTNVFIAAFSIASAFMIQQKHLSQKTKRRLILIAAVVIIAIAAFFAVISDARTSGSNNNAAQNAYAYFAIPVPLLDYWIQHVDRAGAYSLGFSYISGFVANIMNVLARFNIFIHPYKMGELYNYNLVDKFLWMFPDRRYNAYVSMFFAFFLDFREFGVFFGSLLYGYIIARFYRRAEKNKLYLAMYLMLLQSLLWSFIRWHFVIVSYCFGIILLRLLFTSNQNKRIKVRKGEPIGFYVRCRRKG